MKPSRQSILAKTNGRCAYCGIDLKGKFQVDHLKPQNPWNKHEDGFDVNDISNLFAACASCNNYKSNYPLELFRSQIENLFDQLERSSQYKIARRFGLVEEVRKPVVFYFETLPRPSAVSGGEERYECI